MNFSSVINNIKHINLKAEDAYDKLYHSVELVLEAYIKENLVSSSNIKYNSELAKSMVAIEDFSELMSGREEVNEYSLRKHLRNIVKFYLAETNKAHPIQVTDKTRFVLQLEALGLSLNMGQERTWVPPDGNILVMSLLVLALSAMVLLKK